MLELRRVANETGETLYHIHRSLEIGGDVIAGSWCPDGNERLSTLQELVRRYNAHAALVAVCKESLRAVPNTLEVYEKLNAALRAAGEEV